MRLFITGATGQLGRRLVVDRLERGDSLVLVSRDAGRAERLFAANVNPNVKVVSGNPATPGDWMQAVDGCDGVIHLAGAGLADRRWDTSYKKIIADSRIDSTYQVGQAIRDAASPPVVFVSGSAVGYYGDRGDTVLPESQPAGNDFLANLCERWEQQARPLADTTRVVLFRTGIVLDMRGGAMPKMVAPFRWFVGGPIGIRASWKPWIHWRDWVALMHHVLTNERMAGPVNACSPNPVTNWGLARVIGQVMGRPWFFPAPGLALRVVVGEFGSFLTDSQRATPRQAELHDFGFLYPNIDEAVGSLLGTREAHANEDVPHVASDFSNEAAHRVSPASSDQPVASPQGTGAPFERGPSPIPIVQDADVEVPATDAQDANGTVVLQTQQEASPMPRRMPQAPIRLLAIDIDGTLLGSDSRLAPGVIQACRAAARAGCVVVLATARPPRGTRKIVHALNLPTPTINFHGAAIWNHSDYRAQFHEPLQTELVARIVERARETSPSVQVGIEVLDQWYTDRIDPRFEREVGPIAEPDGIGPLDSFLDRPVTRLSFFGLEDELPPIVPVLQEEYWQTRQVSMFMTSPRWVQVLHPLVDKGIALQRIARKMNVTRDEVMAIGDHINDAGMIEWAGFGVAVNNGLDSIKQLADAVVPSNDDLGVARAIQRYVLAHR